MHIPLLLRNRYQKTKIHLLRIRNRNSNHINSRNNRSKKNNKKRIIRQKKKQKKKKKRIKLINNMKKKTKNRVMITI